MLDDLKAIHIRDTRDMLGVAGKRWQVLAERPQPDDLGKVKTILFYGQAADLAGLQVARMLVDPGVPVEILQRASLPSYAGAGTLCIVADDSRERTDRLSGLIADEARRHGCHVAAYSSRGTTPATSQYSIMSLALDLCDVLRHVAGQQLPETEYGQAAAELRMAVKMWEPSIAAKRNEAKRIALELAGKSVVVSGGGYTAPVALAWKSYLNRNAKHVAWASQYPLTERDDLSGWTKQPLVKPYAIVSLSSSFDDDAVRMRSDASRRLLSGLRPEPMSLTAVGSTLLSQILYLLALGEHVSIYLALMAGTDPSASDVLDKYDKEIA